MEWKFNKIEIKRENYGENEGKYKGVVEVSKNYHNSISFSLSDEVLKEMLRLVYPDLCFALDEAGQQFMKELREEIAWKIK